jgi:uncharacterized damage-inducible protein DinB
MKNYFTGLFNYDKHSNLALADLILKANDTDKPVQLMAHLLRSQQVWLARCAGEQASNVPLWPDWEANTFSDTIDSNHRQWTDFLNKLKPEDFEKRIDYKDIKGNFHSNGLTDILAHVINHGTHHRAQVGQHLKFAGLDLPPTDYILYIRQLEQSR